MFLRIHRRWTCINTATVKRKDKKKSGKCALKLVTTFSRVYLISRHEWR